MKTLLYAQSAQIAYFLGTIDLSDRLKVASMIKDEIGEVLDGTPTILPMPDDAPLEIPRIVLSSKDKTTALNVAVSRIDYIYKTSEGEQGIEIKEFQEDFISKVNAINKLLFDKLKATSYRLGLIINYQALLKEGGLGFLKTRFLGDPKDNSIEVQFHKRNQVDISGMKVNNWIRLIGLNQKVANSPLLISSDINTIQEKRYEIGEKNASVFYTEALGLSQKTIDEMLTQEN